jgi:hypothetical protein
MAFFECGKHGGHIASLVSKQVAGWLNENKELADIQIRNIVYIDSNKSKSYFIVDTETLLKLSDTYGIDLFKPIESEELAYELSLEFTAVCPLCLSEWLK